MAPKILTITLNPSLDKTVEVRNFQAGQTFLSSNSWLMPAGKGLNVSRVLNCMGVPSQALILVGEDLSASFYKSCQQSLIEPICITHQLTTRINTTIIDKKGGPETHIRERGPNIPLNICRKLMAKISELVNKSTIVAICGSLPTNFPMQIWQQLLTYTIEHCKYVLVDTSAKPMLIALESGISAAKPNILEFAELISANITSNDVLVNLCKQTQKTYNLSQLSISLGQDGAILADEKKILHATAPKIKIKNSVGAGDAFVAAMLIGKMQQMQGSKILRLAVAMGSAACIEQTAGKISKEYVKKLEKQIDITKKEPHEIA